MQRKRAIWQHINHLAPISCIFNEKLQTHAFLKWFDPSVLFVCLFFSECSGLQQTILAHLSVSAPPVSGEVDLGSLLYWPLQQLHQYSRVLLKLATCYDVVRPNSLLCHCVSLYLSHMHFLDVFLLLLFKFLHFVLLPSLVWISHCFLSCYWAFIQKGQASG